MLIDVIFVVFLLCVVIGSVGLFIGPESMSGGELGVALILLGLGILGIVSHVKMYSEQELVAAGHGEFHVNINGEVEFFLLDFPTNTIDTVVEK